MREAVSVYQNGKFTIRCEFIGGKQIDFRMMDHFEKRDTSDRDKLV